MTAHLHGANPFGPALDDLAQTKLGGCASIDRRIELVTVHQISGVVHFHSSAGSTGHGTVAFDHVVVDQPGFSNVLLHAAKIHARQAVGNHFVVGPFQTLKVAHDQSVGRDVDGRRALRSKRLRGWNKALHRGSNRHALQRRLHARHKRRRNRAKWELGSSTALTGIKDLGAVVQIQRGMERDGGLRCGTLAFTGIAHDELHAVGRVLDVASNFVAWPT